MNQKKYGLFGWKEIENNRREILTEYDRSKAANQSRPVKSSHGFAAEASIRQWLSRFLPSKYGVTSGYIIPDAVEMNDYNLYHFDIIIFDKLNSPVLWEDGTNDTSDHGKIRAIPSQYVNAVIEVKARLTMESSSESMRKLESIYPIKNYLPQSFFTSNIFIEIDKSLKNCTLLENFFPTQCDCRYAGGLVIRSDLNAEMSGVISILRSDVAESTSTNMTGLPIVCDVDNLDIYLNADGDVTIGKQAEGVSCIAFDGKWHYSKFYAPSVVKKGLHSRISWSYNSFSKYMLDTISRLEGRPHRDSKYVFGQIFDKIIHR